MALKRLSLIRGDSHTYNLVFKNSAGVAYCLKNWVVFMTLKASWGVPDAAAALQKIVTTFPDTTAGTSGSASIPFTPSDTSSLTPGEYDFDISARTAAGEVYTVMKGKFDLEYDVTVSAGTSGTAA